MGHCHRTLCESQLGNRRHLKRLRKRCETHTLDKSAFIFYQVCILQSHGTFCLRQTFLEVYFFLVLQAVSKYQKCEHSIFLNLKELSHFAIVIHQVMHHMQWVSYPANLNVALIYTLSPVSIQYVIRQAHGIFQHSFWEYT